MKFSVYKNDLLDALKPVAKCAALKPQTPILSGVKIVAGDGKVTLTATDFNVAAQAVIPANVEMDGEVCVSARYLLEIVNKISDEVITFDADENKLNVSSGGTNFDVPIFNAQEFPTTKFATEPAFKVRSALLKEMLTKTIFAVDKGAAGRPLFEGVNIFTKPTDGGVLLQALATNTHRIAAFFGGHVSCDNAPDFNVVVPVNALYTILAELGGGEEPVTIVPDGQTLIFHVNNLRLKTRLIEGEFPPVDRVLYPDTENQMYCNTGELKNAVETAKVVSKHGEYNAVTLKITNGAINVVADSNECGNFSTYVEAQATADLEIAFNADYLSDFLKTVGTRKVCMRFNGKHDPVQLFGENEDDRYIYVVTPVRV
ncbi:MAG: DNA polymerase III subunit beta [Selenomonadaceae bacterium]|nr:DNA polymerase III subunit beta [Selenomonadaceae bacterium]MBR1805908.1 DNA polymerase III subunit beta [Selenomonadaceae bacterium]